MKPRVEIIALGGTIASQPRAGADGVFPDLDAHALVSAVPALSGIADISARTFAAIPSVNIDLSLLIRLHDLINALERDGVDGVVITQGTDTIEETAFVLGLLYNGACPVVVTGAMRNASQPGADGPANLFAAITCASDPALRGIGTLVVFDDVIHDATRVQKCDTSALDAFRSPSPLGRILEGKALLHSRPARLPHLTVPADVTMPFVPILKPGLGDPPTLVAMALEAGASGLVAELSGGGHASTDWADALGAAARTIPVVFASRTRGGRVLTNTYGQNGAEIDLIRRGLRPTGDLDALKARLVLALLLITGQAEQFDTFTDLTWRANP